MDHSVTVWISVTKPLELPTRPIHLRQVLEAAKSTGDPALFSAGSYHGNVERSARGASKFTGLGDPRTRKAPRIPSPRRGRLARAHEAGGSTRVTPACRHGGSLPPPPSHRSRRHRQVDPAWRNSLVHVQVARSEEEHHIAVFGAQILQ
jgi:hypothetical protein